MTDLYVGLAIIGVLSVGLFLLALRASRRVPRYASDALAVLVVAGMVFYIRYVWYDVRLTSVLPFSNLIIIGNWFPLAAGLLGGLAWRRIPGRFVRKGLFVAALLVVAGYAAVSPLLGQPPRCLNLWSRSEFCVQTAQQTCSPACAATLLRMHGIEATEQEMAELCLTREGTTWMGLYHGLKRKTAGTRWDVRVIECDAHQLLAMGEGPMILSVGLDDEASGGEGEAGSYESEWGWQRGLGHSIIFLGRSSKSVCEMIDPTPGYGREKWSVADLRVLFRGTAVRLVERY